MSRNEARQGRPLWRWSPMGIPGLWHFTKGRGPGQQSSVSLCGLAAPRDAEWRTLPVNTDPDTLTYKDGICPTCWDSDGF